MYDRSTRRHCHRTTTPHKSENKMKRWKKKKLTLCYVWVSFELRLGAVMAPIFHRPRSGRIVSAN